MIEFDCCECRAHVVDVIKEAPPEPPLCATCLHMPGWYEDPALRRTLGAHLPDDVQ